MDIKKIAKFEEQENIWDIKFKKVPVWSYLRGYANQQYLPYTPKIKFSKLDILGLISFLSLFWKKNTVVIFTANRPDLVEYANLVAKEKFPNKKTILFTRSETEHIPGNTFFIETFRYMFRKFFWLFHIKTLLKLEILLKDIGVNFKTNQIKHLIGDYYYNFFISTFLKKSSAIIYSNAVIPRTERYLNLYNSFEIQHGIIHKDHLDYAYVPYIKNNLICYSEKMKDALHKWNFSGNVIAIQKIIAKKEIIKHLVIFSTVDPLYSKFIEEFHKKEPSHQIHSYSIKLHPKDLYPYTDSIKEKCINAISPLSVSIPILPDSSLISDCFLEKKYFIYFSTKNEPVEIIKNYLIDKYNIYELDNTEFDIARSYEELIYLVKANRCK